MQETHRGLRQVISYHWPYYVVASLGCASAAAALSSLDMPSWLAFVVTAGLVACVYWLIVGTVAVWYIFDYSPLTRWQWIPGVLQEVPRRWGNLHVGGDEATPTLRRLYPHATGVEIDFFDPALVTEPGLLRLRGARTADGRRPMLHIDGWSPEEAQWDVAFLIFAAHEMRTRETRTALLARVRSGLRPGGRILLVEHLRDPANFLVFGPAFTHFFSNEEWLLAAKAAGFSVIRRKRVTPFVHAIVLEADS